MGHPHKVLRYACSAIALACATLAQAAPQLIQNDSFWKDTAGNTLYSQGGGILKVGSTYYWYGVKYEGAVTYAANPTKPNSASHFNAVTVYSSTDLVHWKSEGNAMTAGAAGSTLDPANWIGRLGVVYNANTRKYVLISQYWSSATGNAVMFATSSTPAGPFTFHHTQQWITNVVTQGTGDQTIYNDDDGRSFLVFSNAQGRQYGYVAQIRASDSLNIEPATNVTHSSSGGREGNALFKYNGRYYFCSSDLHGWNASHTYCNQATSITGPYGAEAVMGNTDLDFSHVSQNGFFVEVKGTNGTTILYAGDRWSDFAGNGLGYNQWMPLSFNGSAPVANSMSQWYFDAVSGAWSLGPGNNYALNPSFEADRVAQNALAGWQTWTNLTDGTNPNKNVLGGHTGRWSATMSHTAAYSASRYQTVTLPNGTYTLKAWVKSSGGQSAATVYVKKYGGNELNVKVNTPISSWQQISIPNIVVTGGKAEIGFYAAANANNWLTVDDFTLVKN